MQSCILQDHLDESECNRIGEITYVMKGHVIKKEIEKKYCSVNSFSFWKLAGFDKFCVMPNMSFNLCHSSLSSVLLSNSSDNLSQLSYVKTPFL